jgi:hypothetical protein
MKQPKLRRVRKAWGDGLASLPLLDGKRKRKQETVDVISNIGYNTQSDVTPDDIQVLAKIFRDDGLAKRVRQLQKDRYPYGTVPEMVMLDFLERKGETFHYQAQVMGGWRGGGLVPDFVVSRGGTQTAILIQGIYWHNLPGKREKDIADKLRLLGSYYEGKTIDNVVFVWETQIMQPNPKREIVLEDAIVAHEHPS